MNKTDSRRFTYILIAEEGCHVVTAETSIKKISDKYGGTLKLPTYQHLSRLARGTKEEGGEAQFKSKDGTRYKITARRIS